MYVIRPIAMTDAQLISSSVAEPVDVNETAYASGTTYSAGGTCSVIATNSHKKYESKVDGNIGNTPVAKPNETSFWFDRGATMRWKMFDPNRNDKTVGTSPMRVVRKPGQIVSGLAVIGMQAEEINVTVKDSVGAIRYSYAQDLRSRQVLNWYDFFYEPFRTRKSIALFDIPPISDPEITLTLTHSSGIVECSNFIVGTYVDIGKIQYGVTAPRINYSTVERDFDSGINILTPRPRKPSIKGTLIVSKVSLDKVLETLDDLDAKPSIFAGIQDVDDGYFQTLLMNGFARRADPNLAEPNDAYIDLEIEEI